MCRGVLRRAFVVWLWMLSLGAAADELPLWEVALGGGALRIPEYRGSASSETFPFPFVLPLIRSDYLRIDDEGIRGILFDSERLELDLSIDANPDVDSKDTNARFGMPDLDPTLQLGPSLKLRLWHDDDTQRALFLNLPVRAAFSVSTSSVEHVGFTASPHLTLYRHGVDFFGRTWRLGLSGGLEFGSGEFHDYYYRVDPEFAAPGRDPFDAGGGFAGTRFIATLVSRSEKTWISLFARYDRLDGAVFDDSPLVETESGLTVGFIYSWFVARSERRVTAPW